MLTFVLALTGVLIVGFLLAWMLAQKPVSSVQTLIQEHRYEEAAKVPANDSAGWLHRAEALKLLGRFAEAISAYEKSSDPAAQEGIALSFAHLGRDLEAAKSLMERTVASHPQIQEFQALGHSYILLRKGERESALRTYRDNLELLETRFRDDYTDPDPLLAETLIMYATLAEAAGDAARATALRRQAAAWAPGSVWSGRESRSALPAAGSDTPRPSP
jgi:tetratricopeptide (TPR) repeat protein